MSVVEVKGLTVRYGSFTALDNLSVSIPSGSVGLLGPNGAGKTTLIKTILGFVTPASGSATVLGHDVATEDRLIRQKIGLMPEQDCHIPGMSAVQFVAYAGELAGVPPNNAIQRAHEVLEYCGLGEARYRKVETYSTGMKQRIKLAQAIVHGPKLLLLDEPTNGLDPAGRESMLDLIQSVTHEKGLNVLVSSHLLPDIERVCDEVVVVMGGKLVASGLIKDLKVIAGSPVDVELRETNDGFVKYLQDHGAGVEIRGPYSYRVQSTLSEAEKRLLVLAAARESQAQVRGLVLAERSLEEAFLTAVSGGGHQFEF